MHSSEETMAVGTLACLDYLRMVSALLFMAMASVACPDCMGWDIVLLGA